MHRTTIRVRQYTLMTVTILSSVAAVLGVFASLGTSQGGSPPYQPAPVQCGSSDLEPLAGPLIGCGATCSEAREAAILPILLPCSYCDLYNFCLADSTVVLPNMQIVCEEKAGPGDPGVSVTISFDLGGYTQTVCSDC